jgi:hypothetical protein
MTSPSAFGGRSVFEVPIVQGLGAQKFNITIAGSVYIFNLYWSNPMQCWVLNISDQNNNPLILGVPLVTLPFGAGLLDQFQYLFNPAFNLVCQTDNNPYAVPTFAGLGLGGMSHLYAVI